jgi:tetratricopeptide (TPR) repeat protein
VALEMGRGCPDAERLAEYADGVLGPADRADIERHLVECADCRAVIGETMALLQAHPVAASPKPAVVVPFRSRRWVTGVVAGLAAAAVLALAVRVVRPQWVDGLFGPRGDRPELEELIAALANEPTRPVEGRLTGGFKYAPPPSPTRGPGDREVSPDVRIAAAKIENLARERDTPENQAALGVAQLAVRDLDGGITSLERAVQKDPQAATALSDLAAAYCTRGRDRGNTEDLHRALDAAERALAVDPNLVEALFNRATILSLMGRDSRRAWDDYRRRDASSEWARESRQ